MESHSFFEDRFPFLNKAILQSKINWSIRLRWIAIAGFLSATIVARLFFELDIPYESVWGILFILAVINLVYFLVFKVYRHFSFRKELYFLLVHILVDLFVLSWLINMTGGIENPMYIFFVFHIVLSSILFPRPIPYYIATFVVLMFTGLVVGEYVQFFVHHCIFHADLHENVAFSVLVLTVFTLAIYITTYIATSFVWIFRESKREIDGLNQELVKRDDEKARFFRFTSHELKSPLIAVKTSIDSVTKTFAHVLDPKAKSILQKASLRCDQMLDIIRELLMLSRLRREQNLPQKQLIKQDIIHMIQKIIADNRSVADAKNIHITEDFGPHEVYIQGDATDFKQLFGNLISNALRYNKSGGDLKISVQTFGDIWLLVEVSDNGIGIPAAEQAHVFDEFYRAGNARKETGFGTGLGLSLVKQIVTNYAGRIDVESKEGKGTKFSVTLPLNKEHNLPS